MRRTEINRQLYRAIEEELLRDIDERAVGMRSPAIMPRAAAPRGFADDMAVLTHRGLGKINQRLAVTEVEKPLVAVEDIFVMISRSGEVLIPCETGEIIDCIACPLDLIGRKHTRDERKAILVEGIRHARDVILSKCLLSIFKICHWNLTKRARVLQISPERENFSRAVSGVYWMC